MKRIAYILTLVAAFAIGTPMNAQSVRKERIAINEGNELYGKGKYFEAMRLYEEALRVNPQSAEARYNRGLSRIRLSAKGGAEKEEADKVKQQAVEDLNAVAGMVDKKPMLASKANYNLGNLSFNSQDYQQALQFYKQALRLNPNDEDARRNLRITQKKLQQNQDKNKNQNQDQNKDQNKEENKDKNQDKNKDQNKDQNQNKNQQQQQQQNQQPQEQKINPQTAEQILKAVENKENSTRARVSQPGKGDKARNRGGRKNW